MNLTQRFHFAFIESIFGRWKFLLLFICRCSDLRLVSFSFRSMWHTCKCIFFWRILNFIHMDYSVAFQCRAHDRTMPRTAWCVHCTFNGITLNKCNFSISMYICVFSHLCMNHLKCAICVFFCFFFYSFALHWQSS